MESAGENMFRFPQSDLFPGLGVEPASDEVLLGPIIFQVAIAISIRICTMSLLVIAPFPRVVKPH